MTTLKKLSPNVWGSLTYGVLSGVNVFLLTRGGITLSPDSVSYLAMVQIFKTGQWTMLFVRTWPPFYPLSIAFFNSFGFEGVESARIISTISYAALVAAMFLLARAAAGGWVAHLTCITLVFFAPLLFVYGMCWSETLYVTLTAVSLLFLHRFYTSEQKKSRTQLIYAALFVALAFLTRYAGVALFLAGLLVVGLEGGIKLSSRKAKNLILFSLIAWMPMAVFMIGRWYFEGHPIPLANQVVTSLWQNFSLFFGTIYHDFLTLDLRFPAYVAAWRPGMVIPILGKVAGVVLLILCVRYFWLGSFRETVRKQLVPVTYLTCYSVFIIIISTVRYRTFIESRMISSLYPLVILLAFSVMIMVCRRAVRRRIKLLFCGLATLGVLSFWCVQLGSTINLYIRPAPVKLYMQAAPAEEPEVGYPDITGDGIIDLEDFIYLARYLFADGPMPRPLENANVNCDGTIDIADLAYLVDYVYRAGPPPCYLEDP